MANTSLRIGGNNWAVKEDNLLGYNVIQNKYVPIEIDTVRATTATRVNENGLIEVVPKNLASYSEQFDVSPWATLGTITITTNATTAPDGNLTADLILGTNSTGNINQSISGTIGVVYTNSIYIKNNNSNQSQILIRNSVTVVDGKLNWSGNTLTSITNTIGTTTFQSVGNGWYRIVSTYTAVESVQRPRITPTTGTNQSVYIWGAQLEANQTVTSYFPTTYRLNIPRIDYSSGEASLLVEGQRTNLVTYSSDASQWLYSTFVDLTINDTTSPDGTLSADKFQFTDNGSIRPGNVQFTFTNNYCFSVFIKKGNSRYITLTASFFTTPTTVGFDLDTQTAQSGGIIESFNDGWFRLSISNNVTGDADKTGVFYIYLPNSLGGTTSIIGNNAYVWGAQAEEGSYATSYIPTVASTVTRNQDVISKTGISDLINSVEGVLYFEMGVLSNDLTRRVITITDGTTNKILKVEYKNTSNQIEAVLLDGITQCLILYTLTDSTSQNKIAFKYKLNDFALWVNGVKVGTDISGTTFTANTLNKISFDLFGANYFYGKIKNLQLYKTALTDEELQQLTTL